MVNTPAIQCVPLVLRIRSQRIALLRFILEGYDGLATLTTLDAASGLVVVRTPVARYTETIALLDSLAGTLAL